MSSSLLTDDRNHMNGNGIVGTPTSTKITRTVAIIKHHALSHRFEVERRIQESSFEVSMAPSLTPFLVTQQQLHRL